jgi:hypothetical protein
MWAYDPMTDSIITGAIFYARIDPIWIHEDFGELLARVSLYRKGIPETNINKIINLRRFLVAIL